MKTGLPLYGKQYLDDLNFNVFIDYLNKIEVESNKLNGGHS